MKASQLISKARHQAGLTQAELSTRLGTVQPVVARWESGARSPNFETVMRVLRACGFEPQIDLRERDLGEEALLQQWLRLTPIERLRRNEEMLELERWAHGLKRLAG
jgi:transcriptional regulator with XRE-family HTH domain